MNEFNLLKHLFSPHESNNQKAKILHNSSLLVIAFIFVLFQFSLGYVNKIFPSVLGYAANISPSEVISLTNAQRQQNGLSPLIENKTLNAAAVAKGNDMLAKGYWAHFAPDGTSPWSFFAKFGYKYLHAGENLARDFSNASSAVTAWMNSPTHRENILNSNYREIGIGVVEGSLAGADTTIIVQFFGDPISSEPNIPAAKAKETSVTKSQIEVSSPSPIPTLKPTPTPDVLPTQNNSSASTTFTFSPFGITKKISTLIIIMLLFILSIDLFLINRKKIVRIGGRTLAHIIFFAMILTAIIILKVGRII